MRNRQSTSVALTSQDFDQFVSKTEFTVVDFSTEWCPPCRAIEEALTELAPQYQGKIAFGQVDVDTEQDLADRFSVESVPQLVLFKRGEITEVRHGFLGIEKLRNDLERLIEGALKDLTPQFADGDLWDLDDESIGEVLNDIGRAVLFFTGNKSNRRTIKSNMIALAKKYKKQVFFAALDSRWCPKTRRSFNIALETATVVFLHRQKELFRVVGETSEQEYKAQIESLLEGSQ